MSNGPCKFGTVEVVDYKVEGVRYQLTDPSRCDVYGASVLISYLPGDPGDGQIVNGPPSRAGAYGALGLGGVALGVGACLELRERVARRRRWQFLHRYGTGDHPFG